MFSYHCSVLLFIFSLTLWHIKLSISAKIKSPCIFFSSRSKKRKKFILVYFFLILVNINNTSLNVRHFCLSCVFPAVLNFFVFFPSVLEVMGNVIFKITVHDSFFKPVKKSYVNLCTLYIREGDFKMGCS